MELQLTIMVWLINNQGAIATISQATKGVPFKVRPPLRPNVKANHITNTYITGWINAHGKPMYDAKYRVLKSLTIRALIVVLFCLITLRIAAGLKSFFISIT
jgi:hypothetical protein